MLLEQQQQQHQRLATSPTRSGCSELSHMSQQADQLDLDEVDEARNDFVFSTPVRASFRRRPKTMITLEEAKTPSKIDSRTRLRETKSKRRWSNLELAENRFQPPLPRTGAHDISEISNYVPEINDRSDIPSGIEPSLVAVWSQFLNYEATLPTLETTPSICPPQSQSKPSNARTNLGLPHSSAATTVGHRAHQRPAYYLNSTEDDMTQLSDIKPPSSSSGMSQGLRDYCANMSSSLMRPDQTQLSMMPSMAVDGTSTQLLVESFNRPTADHQLSYLRHRGINNSSLFQQSQTTSMAFPVRGIEQSTLLSNLDPGLIEQVRDSYEHQQDSSSKSFNTSSSGSRNSR